LDQDNWLIIQRYMEVLKPLMLATKKLEVCTHDYCLNGALLICSNLRKNGALWEVLPIFEKLLETLEQFKTQYEHIAKSDDDLIHHLILNMQLGWQKLDYYYS
ncbi:hypothetical protein K469DRAFT_530416, partial [Zopfia rhizophila CBS 207.26]